MVPAIEEILRQEVITLRTKNRKKDVRFAIAESLMMSLTEEVQKLNVDLKRCYQNCESKIKTTKEIHTKEIKSLEESKESELAQQRKESKERTLELEESLNEANAALNKFFREVR